ncbi:MAG: vitamin B12 dependent-methionine synthase activation domain-containing protein [Candidatus Nitrospinota bacterium M3_3B_026]
MKKATVLENIPFTIEQVRVLREMKIPHVKSLDEIEEKPLAGAIGKAIDKAYTLIHGRGVFKTCRLTGVEAGAVRGEGVGDVFSGPAMVKLLGGCDFATLLACTIGPELEAEVERLEEAQDMTGAYILDMIGGWMADYMADRVDERVEREIRRAGYERTMRYSPGYGDWTLERQPDVLRLAEAERIGIRLTETNIMIPRKSVSAVIGWKPKTG